MGKEWEKTPDQKDYLESQVPGYIAARAAERQEPFMKAFVGGWLDRWSERTALFDEATPDSPPLSKDQLDQLGRAVSKRRKVCSCTYCSNSAVLINSN